MTKRRRGASLQIVLSLVLIMAMLALTMTALYMTNLNFTQASLNRTLALQEAETGVHELLARLIAAADYGSTGNEVLASTCSVDVNMSDPDPTRRAGFHVISFQKGGPWPYSSNCLGSGGTGYGGRSLPVGSVHVLSVGYHKGQYVTLEVLLQHPPFPYGLACDGPVRSLSALVVQGTTGVRSGGVLELDRPGHVASNAAVSQAVDIAGDETLITGFIQTPGTIKISPQAVVRGGLKPGSEPLELPKINFANFSQVATEGVKVLDPEFFERQHLNTLYYSARDLSFQGGITFEKGLVRCTGNVLVKNGVDGEGAIISDGDVTIQGGASLTGSNKVAIVARGKITLQGGDSNFQGLVYSEAGVEADHVTIVGNTVVNVPEGSTASGEALMKERVRVVADSSVGKWTLSVARPGAAQYQSQPGRFPIKPSTSTSNDGTFYFPVAPVGLGPPYYPPENNQDVSLYLDAARDGFWAAVSDPNGPPISINRDGDPIEAGASGVLDMYAWMGYVAADARPKAIELKDARDALAANPDDPALQARVNSLQSDLDAIHDQFVSVEGQARGAFMAFFNDHTRTDGSAELPPPDASDPPARFDFDLNTFMPPSDSYRITFWQLRQGRQ